MGLLSNIFKKQPKKVVETPLGSFTLMFSKKSKQIWSNNSGVRLMSVRGTDSEPDTSQLVFLENIDSELLKLRTKINNKFLDEFREASLEPGFITWEDRFKIVGVEVMLIFNEDAYWNITFEDMKEPYAHFTLYIEGQKMTDFSIDT